MPDLVLKHPTGSAGGKPVLFYTTEEVGGEVGGSRRVGARKLGEFDLARDALKSLHLLCPTCNLSSVL